MQTPPDDLPDHDVLGVVRAGWVADADTATYLPVGFGSHHWAVTGADGSRWFASADPVGPPDPADGSASLDTLTASFRVAATARDAGVAGAHGPRPDGDGAMVRRTGRWAVSVQPWLDGAAGRFSDRVPVAEAEALVRLLAGLHGVAAPDLPVEDTALPRRAGLEAVLGAVEGGATPDGGPLARDVVGLLREHGAAVRAALAAFDDAPDVDATRLVTTHGEPHPGNVVLAGDGPVLVDWDTARRAEPERDLWHVEERSDLDVAAAYTVLTGVDVDRARLRWRRLHWSLVDVADYVPTLVAARAVTADTTWQLEALEGTLASL